MDWFRSLFRPRVKYEDTSDDDKITAKDLLAFMEKQQAQNTELIKAVLENSASQSRTLENYIDLFKPQQVPSSTLEQREKLRHEKVQVRKSEWEGISNLQDFNAFTAGGIPPEPDEF